MADCVEALILRLAPEPICDQCIFTKLSLGGLDQVRTRTGALVGMRGFERLYTACATCGERGPVTRALKA